MANLPYVTTVPTAGQFSKIEPPSYVQGSMMYFNGDFKAYRTFNAVFNDYAEFFTTIEPIKSGDIVIDENDNLIGISSDSYGRVTGTGNTAVCLTGRVVLNSNVECNSGDFLYYDNSVIKIVEEWNEKTISNKLGKVLYKPTPNQILLLV